eukprot:455600_1
MVKLFQRLALESQVSKILLVSGYIRRHIDVAHADIAQLCFVFYDEVIHWAINIHPLEDRDYYFIASKPFYCQGVKFICTLDPDATHNNQKGYAIVYVRATLDKSIKSIKFYFRMFCQEKAALFQRVVKLTHASASEDFWLIIECNQFKQMHLSHHIDMLQIKYTDDSDTQDFNKPIVMKKALRFEWKIDRALLDKFMNATAGQYFVSDTFDSVNNNWCLRLYPNSGDNLILMPVMLRCPHGIAALRTQWIVTCNELVENTTLAIDPDDTFSRDYTNSNIISDIAVGTLSTLDELIIAVELEVVGITVSGKAACTYIPMEKSSWHLLNVRVLILIQC